MTGRLADIATLDERWLAFVERTRGLFAAYPFMLPLRQAIFKDLVERGKVLSAKDQAKALARPLLKRQGSVGDFAPVDVAFWLESSREVLTEAVLPVQQAVQAAGLRVALVAAPTVHVQLQGAFPAPILFQVPFQRSPAAAWSAAWDALNGCLPHDLKRESRAAFLEMGQASQSCVAEAMSVLAKLRPRLLVLPVDQLLTGSAACVAARELGIATLVLLHGAVSPYNVPLTADRMGVWGAVSRDQLVALGVSPDDLVILGSPRHDHFPAPVPPDVKARLRAALGLPDLPVMVFFSNGNDPRRNSHEAVAGCAAWLDEAAAQLRGRMTFIVRLHPNEDGGFYKDCSHLRVFKHEADLATTLAGADVCGALCSTTLVDALLYDKPVLQFYADGWPDLADNWRRGLARRVANAGELADVLAGGLSDGWQALAAAQAAQVDSVFAHRGRATQTVADYIVEQVGQRV